LDEITIQITTALRVKLLSGGNVRTASTTNFEAWSHYVKGGIHFLRFTKQDNIKARKLFQQAVKLDPEYVEAWTNLGWTHCIDARNGFTETPLDSMEQAELTAQKASAIDDSVPLLQTLWASLYLIQRQHDKAIVAGQKAIELNPNNANGYALLAQIMFYSNRPDEAITLMQKAMRLSPYPPAYYLLFFGMAYQVAGQYQEAHPVLLKLLDRAKKGEFYLLFAHNTLALNFALMGDYKKAQEHWTEVLKIYPDASLDFVRSLHYFKDPAPLERFLDAYRAAGVAEHPPLKLPDKPSIAVLPFDNMGGDPEHEYIADGFTENIITGLSQIPEMFVIARSSVFTYKGKSVKVQQVSKELGVKYVLEGSIQKAGERLRVNAQLIDAIKGNHLWAEFYDRELKDLFVLLDEIITNILNTLQSKLVYGDKGNWTEWNRTGSFEAWSLATKGLKNFDRITKEDNRKAQKYFEQATKLDSEYAFAWTMLAYTINLQGVMGWSESPADSTKRAREIMQKVSEQWGYNAFLHSLKSRNYLFQGQHEKSIVEGKKAIELVPNNSRFHILLANSLNFAGRPKEAIVHAKKAMRLEPFYPAWFLPALANSYEMLGRYEEAIEIRTQLLKRALKGEAPPIWAYEHLATCYASLGQMADAKAHVAEILKINPNYNVETFRKGQRAYEDQTYVERLANLLIKAGLPE
jgi:TolB-like protein/predicted Zn-dependent protease